MLMSILLQAAVPAACPTPVALPAGLTGWNTPVAAGASIAVGRAAAVALVADPRFAVAPGRAPKPGTKGAALDFTVAAAGPYRVALDSGLWIDLVRDGVVVASTTHGHGPACSGVRKIVGFDLAPGRYGLQLSGGTAASARVMVVFGR